MFIEEKTMHKSMKDLDILTAYIILKIYVDDEYDAPERFSRKRSHQRL